MENRYKNFVHENEPGTTYSKNYVNPPIPEGYKHVEGRWNNGFVIERTSDGSQFVWVPVGSLDSNGTLDGVSFNEKFGRRIYRKNPIFLEQFTEPLVDELKLQFESVKKYGGFYISRYNISKNLKTGKPQSIKGSLPCAHIDFSEAQELASTMEISDTITSHLTFGAEYDSVLEWFLHSGARTFVEIAMSSTYWGNYKNTSYSVKNGDYMYTKCSPNMIANTGYWEEWKTNNIYDFAGNVSEWTQEKFYDLCPVVRGGSYYCNGLYFPAAYRSKFSPTKNIDESTGFRVVLLLL